jgi:hypothetical protein
MTATSNSTPFPLGAYVGNPDNSSAANQATFENQYNQFSAQLGAAPQFLDYYIDYSQPVSQWAGNAAWQATSAAASADAKTATPVIALPLASNASGSMSADQQFQAFAAGQYDSTLQSIVQAYAQQGFKTLYFRPGWEMNLTGPTYAGDSAQSQADWVKAFQHVYTVLHQAAAADGIQVSVVWNPGTTSYSNAEATTNLYPGDNYVDVIGADVYADAYPYSDSSPTASYHDWDTGGEDSTTAQLLADPVNRIHYWNAPAATEYSSDGSGGHSQSLASLIQFAEQHGKPLAIPETGAGNSNSGTDVKDDAAFPTWLAQQLSAAQTAGESVKFINIWDSNGGGNYEFTSAADGKPNEAAAWAQAFGAQPTVAATAPDVLDLHVSEDAWQGDAQFTVTVDGKAVGGTYTATASHAAGATQDFALTGSWGSGAHVVGISFINDAYGGTAVTDRNLYLNQATYDGKAVSGTPITFLSSGTSNLAVATGSQVVAKTTTLTLHLAEDAWNGNAQYSVSVDGTQLAQSNTVTALNSLGQTQTLTLQDMLSAGTHDVALSFLNDAYGGTATTDRNLYLKGIDVNGTAAPGSSATLLSTGTTHLQIVVPSS